MAEESVIPSEVRSIHLLGSSVNKVGTSPKDLRLWVEVVAGINHQRRATRQFGGGWSPGVGALVIIRIRRYGSY